MITFIQFPNLISFVFCAGNVILIFYWFQTLLHPSFECEAFQSLLPLQHCFTQFSIPSQDMMMGFDFLPSLKGFFLGNRERKKGNENSKNKNEGRRKVKSARV